MGGSTVVLGDFDAGWDSGEGQVVDYFLENKRTKTQYASK
jgi:hypothetical protein